MTERPLIARIFLHPAILAASAAVALTVIGIVVNLPNHHGYAMAQLKWLVIALAAMVAFVVPQPRVIGLAAFPLAVVVLVLLLILVLPGMPRWIVPVRNGTRAWIDFKLMMFQPSEVAKIVFVLAVARYLRFRENYRTLRGLLVPFCIMFVPVMLILKQPDLGTAILFAPALFAMLVAAGAKLKHLGMLVSIALIVVVVNIAAIYLLPDNLQLLRPHQRDRIVAMISQAKGETRYIDGKGYQQHKSMTLAGSGQIFGYGEEQSARIVENNKLPEDHNDMIFAVITNRWGMAGAVVVLLLFGIMVGGFLLTAAMTKDPFARLSAVGFAGLLFVQMVINVGMNIGLLPIIGITLPFVSYGGSSLVATFLMVGLVLNFALQKRDILVRPSFEFGSGAGRDLSHSVRRA